MQRSWRSTAWGRLAVLSWNQPAVLALPATLLLFFGNLAFSENTLWFRDIHHFFYPMKFFLGEGLRQGLLPYWRSNHSCGTPFLDDIQSGVLYPPAWLFRLPLPHSFNWYVLLHLGLAFWFCYLYLKELNISPRAATLAAISFCYGGFTIATINTLNSFSTAIWLPAVLWARRRAFSRPSAGPYLLTILFLCLAILGGEPQLFLMIVALMVLCDLSLSRGLSVDLKADLRQLLVDAALLVSAVVVTLPQLGPTYTNYQYSYRLAGIPFEDAAKNSLSWGMLKHLVLPLRFPPTFADDPSSLTTMFPGESGIPWLMTVYPGFLVALLAAAGLVSLVLKRQLLWPVVAAAAVFLALGSHTPVFRIFYRLLPYFRYPSKFMLLAGFALLVMAAFGCDAVMNRFASTRIPPAVLFLAAVTILTADLWHNHRHLNPVWPAASYQRRHPDLDVIIEDRTTFRVFIDVEAFTRLSQVDSIRSIRERYQDFLLPDVGCLQGLSYVNGMNGLELRSQYMINELLEKPLEEIIGFLRLTNVKYIVSPRDLDRVPGLAGSIVRRNQVVWQVLDPMPRAWLVGRISPVPPGTKEKYRRWDIADLGNGSFDPATTALAAIREPSGIPFSAPAGEARYRPDGSIALQVNAERPGFLVLSESWYPGWRVLVDGQEVEPLRVNLLFLGVPLGAGEHRVVFSFRPRNLGLFLAIAGGYAVALILVVPRLVRRSAGR